ncbi:CIC11C00000000707 [Sungouiella intermedia]|uniref:CIC11C00000000707 n=1 Tax=Sungouiella intermedia TaxID=45354 RepID=A0A1L0D2W2_9ASCO|nr:CIC11C00000000707 [[Candida] intermedia]
MPESFLSWDPAQVSSYLRSYVDQDVTAAFIENNIDGSLLPFLTTEHLRELGIPKLGSRLRAKRAINDLMAQQFADAVPTGPNDPNFRLTSVNINSNYVSMEALSLCAVLLRDINKFLEPKPDTDALDLRKLNDNFNKLKTDLNPVIRLMKESKPLPTPTLDPSVGVLLPTYSSNSIYSTNSWLTSESDGNNTSSGGSAPAASASAASSVPSSAPSLAPSSAPGSSGATTTLTLLQTNSIPKSTSNSSLQRQPSVASPTYSKRFSSGSVLSMGVGKITEVKSAAAGRYLNKPRLVEARQSPITHESEGGELPGLKLLLQLQMVTGGPPSLKTKASTNLMATSRTVTEMPHSQTGNQPLKQLKASTDDTCLKVLQLAMRRHHIPREKWSKYVLVICYGDKERILKLTEKPVLVFKELQGHEKNPTIMLRELAVTNTKEQYEDSRIGDEIPGGTL